MKFRDILAIVSSQTPDEQVIGFAEQLAKQNSGYLSSLVVNWTPSLPLALDGFVVAPFWDDMLKAARNDLKVEVARIAHRLEGVSDAAVPQSSLIEIGSARSSLGMRARHADVTIVGRPTKAGTESANILVEGPLFESGRPVMIVPPEWKRRDIGKSVLVCWKPTREAARALGDAEDFLGCANRVTVVTVDANPSEKGYGEHPGADISKHLARRDVKTELVNLDSTGRSEAKAIQDQAIAVDADLIVMGGYGRSRMSEFIFGGLTREMLSTSRIPVLMSH